MRVERRVGYLVPSWGTLTLAIMTRAGQDIWMSSLPPETLPIWHCVIIMSGNSHELVGCYHKEGRAGFLYISGAKRKEWVRRLNTFFTAKTAMSSTVISGKANILCLQLGRNLNEHMDPAFRILKKSKIYIIFHEEDSLCTSISSYLARILWQAVPHWLSGSLLSKISLWNLFWAPTRLSL